MKKIDYEKKFSKALKGGMEMLEHAQRLDSLANENPDLEKALQQRTVASILRGYYSKLFE